MNDLWFRWINQWKYWVKVNNVFELYVSSVCTSEQSSGNNTPADIGTYLLLYNSSAQCGVIEMIYKWSHNNNNEIIIVIGSNSDALTHAGPVHSIYISWTCDVQEEISSIRGHNGYKMCSLNSPFPEVGHIMRDSKSVHVIHISGISRPLCSVLNVLCFRCCTLVNYLVPRDVRDKSWIHFQESYRFSVAFYLGRKTDITVVWM